MGEWSGFFPSSGGDRKYKTAHIAAITDALFHSGVCQSDDLTLAPAGAMTAALGAGRALVNGYHYQNDSPLTLTFGYADGTLARIDAVMLRRDVNSRDIHAVVVPGTPAINPTAPACTRDADAYDLCLYHVRIPAGATAITASMITDRRADADLCGYVYCKFSGIGTSVMQAAVDEMISAVSSELNQLNAGTAVMTKAQYDPNGSGVDVTAQIYKCTKSGKVYALTGHGGFGRFKVPAAWASGDTWTVNGTTVPAYCGADAVDGDTIVAGRWAIFTFDGQQLNFNGGGGLSSGKLARATAKASQVLDGVPFYAGSKTLQKGTMRNNGSWPDADKLTLENGKLYMYKANGYTEGGLEAVASLLGDASASDIMQGTAASSSKGLHVAGSIVDRGNWSAQIVPGGKVTIPPGRHAGDGSVSAAALKTMALRVSDWPHEYPGMEWHYTLTGGTLVGVAGLGRASGDASSNVIESIRIAGNTIYVKNASGGYPMRDITLLYY